MTHDAASTEEQVVLDAVGTLLARLHPGRPPVASLDSDLESDLGIDSLTVAELLVRLEVAFDVELPAELLGMAITPRDLLDAVHRAPRAIRPRLTTIGVGGTPPEQPLAPASRAVDLPTRRPADLPTLVDTLAWAATSQPDRLHVRVLDEHGRTAGTLTHGQLQQQASTVARALRALGVRRGDAVALMLPTGLDYFTTFMGVLLAGATAVPIYPPDRPSRLAEHLGRQRDILRSAGAVALVTDPAARTMAKLVRAQVDTLRVVRTPEELGQPGDGAAPLPRPGPDDVALLQYTSGSTGDPKGVVLTHHHLVANIDAMAQVIGATPQDVFVSWLPLYHDMGLIGAWLGSLRVGMTLVSLPPQAFLLRPASWLQAVTDHGGTFTAAPNFAYELCLRRITDEQLDTLDLHTLRRAFNGAEAVDPGTVRRFTARFARCGLGAETVAPVYGLAEAAVGVAFPPQGRPPVIDRIDRRTFQQTGRARPADDDAPPEDVMELAACGLALVGYGMRIVDDRGRVLPPRTEGNLQFRGPSATDGYRANPAATRDLVDGDWRNTGDLAYLADGDVVLTGRVKDLIIRAGRNLHPQELERTVGGVEGVRAGCVVAVGVPDADAGTERLVVVAETRRMDDDEALATIRTAVAEAAVDLLGTPPDDIVLVGPGAVPKTSSGKLRRAEARSRYLQGELVASSRPAWAQLTAFAATGWSSVARRVRRGAAAALEATVAWTVAGLLTPPLAVALLLLPTRRWRWAAARVFVRLAARAIGLRVTYRGPSVPEPPSVVVANHASWIDGFVMAAVLPGTVRLVAGEVLGGRTFRGLMLRRLGAVFVDRHDRTQGVTDAATMSRLAEEDGHLLVFPEGGLARDAGLRSFRLGGFAAAAQAGVPVVPVAIRGTRQVVPPGSHRLRRGPIDVVVGDPIEPTGASWADVVSLRDAARTHIARHCGEADLRP